ncbi:TetR/AcrR family transcriptional regulator [Leifsonia sp. fls2-241-R2A-40a]|uniref:TetR/AcrR family transcriptional regulator n=1 Tax=Leifsonia sp. fls2-241-R2A-40a TaxID=3040290 RepID=UPI002550F6BC|nr:TetR/AcrR family transcriptional regulator [Leifsonia sp. fls2-241-R2A-40a]
MDSTTLSDDVTTDQREEAPAESARRQRTRARLLDAAFDVFAEHGVRAASVETIAEAAGFTRGAFYSNFSSKEELFFALMEREKTMRLEQLNSGVAQFLAPLVSDGVPDLGDQDVLQTITRILELQTDDRRWWLVQAEFQLMALRDHSIAADYLRYQDEFFSDLTEIVVEALTSAGRRFTIKAEEAVRVIAELCASEEARAVLAGDERTFPERLSESVPAILLALTERV